LCEKGAWKPSGSDGKEMFVSVMCSMRVQVWIAWKRWCVAAGTICGLAM